MFSRKNLRAHVLRIREIIFEYRFLPSKRKRLVVEIAFELGAVFGGRERRETARRRADVTNW